MFSKLVEICTRNSLQIEDGFSERLHHHEDFLLQLEPFGADHSLLQSIKSMLATNFEIFIKI